MDKAGGADDFRKSSIELAAFSARRRTTEQLLIRISGCVPWNAQPISALPCPLSLQLPLRL